MLIVAMSTKLGTPESPLGAIGCSRIAPVTDYSLLTRDAAGGEHRVSLECYPRFAEPAFALVVRLFAKVPEEHRVRAVEPLEYVSASVHLRSGHQTIRLLEHLVVVRDGDRVAVQYANEFDDKEVDARARDAYPSALDLLEHGGRVALWGGDLLPPAPPPLTSVPIKVLRGHELVYEQDIPAFARQHFVARSLRRAVPKPGTFYAEDWRQFIGER